jgi:hypothetical protein
VIPSGSQEVKLRTAERQLAAAAQGVNVARRSVRINYICLAVTGFFTLVTLGRILHLIPPYSTSWVTPAALGINLVGFAALLVIMLPLRRRSVRKAGALFVERENAVAELQRDGQR